MPTINGSGKRPIAEESPKTKKARDKLRARFAAENQQFTPQALQETVGKIHDWIASNAQYRVPVARKSMRLFAQNDGAVAASRKVQELAKRLADLGKAS